MTCYWPLRGARYDVARGRARTLHMHLHMSPPRRKQTDWKTGGHAGGATEHSRAVSHFSVLLFRLNLLPGPAAAPTHTMRLRIDPWSIVLFLILRRSHPRKAKDSVSRLSSVSQAQPRRPFPGGVTVGAERSYLRSSHFGLLKVVSSFSHISGFAYRDSDTLCNM